MTDLFKPDLQASQEYGRRVSDLFYKLGYIDYKIVQSELEQPINIGNIPYVLRTLGIPSGSITLRPSKVPHMIGFGQEKTGTTEQHMHNLTLQEMLEIPNMIYDPDAIFRSTTHPNESIIVCRELERRNDPVLLAMQLELHNNLSALGIVVSGYEKTEKSKQWFSRLYNYGYCLYSAERSEFFNSVFADTKKGTGVRDRPRAPIALSAVTCTVPDLSVRTKSDIVNDYRKNSETVVSIIQEKVELATLSHRNLMELGFHALMPTDNKNVKELDQLLKKSDVIVCDRNKIREFSSLKDRYPNIKHIGEAKDLMPSLIFSNRMKSLSETISMQKKTRR